MDVADRKCVKNIVLFLSVKAKVLEEQSVEEETESQLMNLIKFTALTVYIISTVLMLLFAQRVFVTVCYHLPSACRCLCGKLFLQWQMQECVFNCPAVSINCLSITETCL